MSLHDAGREVYVRRACRAAGRRPIADRRVHRSRGASARCRAGDTSSSPERVLTEMRGLGLAATEFGPDGFLADDPQRKAAQLAAYGIRRSAASCRCSCTTPTTTRCPRSTRSSTPAWRRRRRRRARGGHRSRRATTSGRCSTSSAGRRCSATSTGSPTTPRSRGVIASLHPHIGTMVETAPEVERVLAGSKVGLCVDTGHLAVGGADPVALTRDVRRPCRARAPQGRRRGLAERVIAGELTFADGASRPASSVRSARATSTSPRWCRTLEAAGYHGWYVLEQDVMLDGEPDGRRPGRQRPRLPRLPARGGRVTRTDVATQPLRGADDGPRRRRHLPRAGRRRARGRRRRSASTSAAVRPTSRSPRPGTAAAVAVITRTGADPFGRFIHRALRGVRGRRSVRQRRAAAFRRRSRSARSSRPTTSRSTSTACPRRPTWRSTPTSSTSTRSRPPTSSG